MPITRRITGPAAEWLSVADAKLHLRVDLADDDSLIAALISAVRDSFERRARRTLIDSTLETTAGSFLETVDLPFGPVRSVTSVKYLDEAGAEQTLSPAVYVVDVNATVPELLLASGASWPATAPGRPDAARVRYTAGWGSVSSGIATGMPESAVLWLKLQLAHFYDNRASTGPDKLVPLASADVLLDTLRVRRF